MSRIYSVMMVLPLALLLAMTGCQRGAEKARWELRQLGIRWSQERFLESVENSDLVLVKLFLKAGMNPNMTNEYGWTPLMHAALAGHIEVARSLMTAGASVNARGEGGLTALSLAAGSGRDEAVTLLLGAAADVNAKDAEGWTALMYAAERGYADIVKALLANHADVNAKNKEGLTALYLAESQGHAEVAKLLKQAGASGDAVRYRTLYRASKLRLSGMSGDRLLGLSTGKG